MSNELQERIELLVENELTDVQRNQLIRELSCTPNGWQQIAVAFLDNQFLDNHLNDVTTKPLTESRITVGRRKVADQPSSSFQKSIWATTALCFALILGTVVGLGLNRFRPAHAATSENVMDASLASLVSVVEEAESVIHPLQTLQTTTTHPLGREQKVSRLYEIENTPQRAVYCSPDPLPEFILQSMIYAGHEVDVTLEHLESSLDQTKNMTIPVYSVRILKNQRYEQIANIQ